MRRNWRRLYSHIDGCPADFRTVKREIPLGEEIAGAMNTRYRTDKPRTSIEGTTRPEADNSETLRNSELSTTVRPPIALARDETEPEPTYLPRLVGSLAGFLMVAAVLASAALLLADAWPHIAVLIHLLIVLISRASDAFGHAPLSALPLLLAGASYTVLQALLRPPPLELLRRLMLGAAFLLWGVVQLMPAGRLATELGDLVIALYVFDLGLMIQAELQRN
jgi:hypothetical protein